MNLSRHVRDSDKNPSPTLFETVKIFDTGINPASWYLPMDASPAEAPQPHSEHTGCPPNWQGRICVVKSAEMQFVVCANMHSSGALGGE